MINKTHIRYMVIPLISIIAVMAMVIMASQNTIKVNVNAQGVGPLGNASITYMEYVQSYNTQLLYMVGQTMTNAQGVAEIPQPPPPLPGKEDVIVISINATIGGRNVFNTYYIHLTSNNLTNEINITIPAPTTGNAANGGGQDLHQGLLILIAILITVIVIIIVVATLMLRRKR
ncbi:MAG: hypothetical protein ACP5GY_09015 [Vulcanisaeta sp.]